MKTEKKIIQYQIYKRIYIGKHRESVWMDCSYSTYKRYSESARRIKDQNN